MIFDWELIYSRKDRSFTSRAKVIGGWLVQHTEVTNISDDGNEPISNSMVFIPDPFFEWKVEKNLN